MATAGPNNASSAVEFTGAPYAAWANLANTYSEDGLYADADLNSTDLPKSQTSRDVDFTGFGFSIPAGATIDGVLVEAKARMRTTADNAYWSTVGLKSGVALGGSSTGTMYSDWISATAFTYYTAGGATDKWGIAADLTPTNVNNSTFGIRLGISVNGGGGIDDVCRIDHVRITVYYTEASGGARCVQTRQAVNRASTY